MESGMKEFRVSWNETHSVVVLAKTSREAEEKVGEMTLRNLKMNPTYEVQVGKIMGVMNMDA